jgi:hypothetical protein
MCRRHAPRPVTSQRGRRAPQPVVIPVSCDVRHGVHDPDHPQRAPRPRVVRDMQEQDYASTGPRTDVNIITLIRAG